MEVEQFIMLIKMGYKDWSRLVLSFFFSANFKKSIIFEYLQFHRREVSYFHLKGNHLSIQFFSAYPIHSRQGG